MPQGQTGEVINNDHLVRMKCSAGKPFSPGCDFVCNSV